MTKPPQILLVVSGLLAVCGLALWASSHPQFFDNGGTVPLAREEGLAEMNLAAIVTLASGAKADFDVNRDGYVNVKDLNDLAVLVQQSLTSTSPTPTASSTNPYDLNKNGSVELADWGLMSRYFVLHSATLLALFDYDSNGLFNGTDVTGITARIQSGLGGGSAYQVRYDFDADGRLSHYDWNFVLTYALANTPLALYDWDNSGNFAGNDLQTLVSQIQSGLGGGTSYQVRYDFDADGRLSHYDWAKVLGYVNDNLKNPKLLYDWDNNGTVAGNDVITMASQIGAGLGGGSSYQLRFDFDADGRLSHYDWAKVLAYVNDNLKNPKLLYDWDNNGTVAGNDVTSIATQIQTGMSGGSAYQVRYDFDADGRLSHYDWAKVSNYVLFKARQALHLLDVNNTGTVNATDVNMIKAAVGSTNYTLRYDLNADGRVSQHDVDLISSY